ncbi:MAG: 5'-3' exonuclease [Nocardioidaceae bacterium]|nr:MAG: 5'-3' exonuclease [Nocardioidaceae bacterium]
MLLDTASLYFRAFYGVPDNFHAADGTPVNAVRGLLSFINTLVSEYRPTHLACCWDNDWRPQWRVDLIPSYKAHRVEEVVPGAPDVEEVPDPLEVQVPLILEVLAAFGIAVVGADGYEADDVIGTLAYRATMPTDVVTGDRDLFQVIDDAREVRVLYVARGVAKHERVTDEVVRAKYGVSAAQYADFAALRGDTSDGLPGVPGVGEKTAAGLLASYPDIPTLLQAAADPTSQLAPGPRRKLLDAVDYLAVAPKVCEVATDLDLPGDDALVLPRTPVAPEALAELARRLDLESTCARLVNTLNR